MARRNSGGRSRSSGFSSPSRAASPPKPKSKPTSAPAPTSRPAPAPAPVNQTGSATGGLGSAIAEGMAFGGGNAIAHRAVDALMGPRTVRYETAASAPAAEPTPCVSSTGSPDACASQCNAFKNCLNSSVSEISKCQFYMNMLAECRKSSASGGLIV